MVQRGVRPASLAMASMVSTFPTSDRIDIAANTAPRITVCNGKENIQDSAKRWSPGCVNAPGKARQNWYARARTIFTKPGDRLLAEPCIISEY